MPDKQASFDSYAYLRTREHGRRGEGKKGGGGNSGTEDIWKAQKLILKGLKEMKEGQTAMAARLQVQCKLGLF